MNCFIHETRDAVGTCTECGRNVCEICLNKQAGKMYCDTCAQRLSSKSISTKSRTSAILLTFFLGGIGAHKFYLGKSGWGILYLLFCWTFIPALVAFIEMIQYIIMSDEQFQQKFG